MIKYDVLPLNAIIATTYLIFCVLLLYIFKKSHKTNKNLTTSLPSSSSSLPSEELDMNRVIILSYLKKYTLLGTISLHDKKYLLKQFVFIACYGVSCLKINRVIIWPVSISAGLMVISFICLEVLVKKYQNYSSNQNSKENRVDVLNHQAESQLQI